MHNIDFSEDFQAKNFNIKYKNTFDKIMIWVGLKPKQTLPNGRVFVLLSLMINVYNYALIPHFLMTLFFSVANVSVEENPYRF